MKKRLTSYIKYPEVVDQLCRETYNTVSSTTLEDLIYYQLFGEYQEIQNIMLQLYADEKSLAEAAIDVLDFFYFNFPEDRLSLKRLFGCVIDMVSTAYFPEETMQNRGYNSANIDSYSIGYIYEVLKAKHEQASKEIDAEIRIKAEKRKKDPEHEQIAASDKLVEAEITQADLVQALMYIKPETAIRSPSFYIFELKAQWKWLYDNPNVCQVYGSVLALASPINDSCYMRKAFREAVLDHINFLKAQKYLRDEKEN